MVKDKGGSCNFILEAEEIDRVAEQVSGILTSFTVEKKTAVKARLLVEDLLLRIMGCSSCPVSCSFSFYKRLGNGTIRIRYDGEPFDPLTQDNDEFSALLLENLGVPCKWDYKNKVNTLYLTVKKQRKTALPALLAAIIAAIVLGLGSSYAPASVTEAVSARLLVPFRGAFLGLLNAFACLLIFLSVIAGMCGDKSAKPLGAAGKKILLRQPLIVLVITVACYLCLVPFFGLSFGTHNVGVSQADEVSELLWGIVPGSLITPFTDGNYIQIVILAIVFGLALSAVRDSHPELVAVIGSANSIIMTVTEKLCRFIPLFVFCSLFDLVRSSVSVGALPDIWKPIVTFAAAGVVLTVIVFIYIAIRFRCNSLKVLKAMLPAFLIVLSTGSPVSSFSTNLDILENSCGVSGRFSKIGLAIGSRLYLPGVSLYLAVMVLYFAEKYQTPFNAVMIIIAMMLTVLLTYACPPIPGSFLVIFGVMAKQFGFPDECMMLLATVDIVLDGLSSGLCCVLRNAEIIIEADDYRELDREALKKL